MVTFYSTMYDSHVHLAFYQLADAWVRLVGLGCQLWIQ
jgi:hypothetical protein